MDIIVKGRHTYVPEAFRNTVNDKLAKFDTQIPDCRVIEVEISHENNPKLSDQRLRVEITAYASGPVVRAEAAASEALDAFDLAFGKIQERFRRHRDKIKHHHAPHQAQKEAIALDIESLEADLHKEAKLAKTIASLADSNPEESRPTIVDASHLNDAIAVGESIETKLEGSPVTVRKKVHASERITVEEAIDRMELIGHDFYAFTNDVNGRGSVVYRRHGWSYGVIELA